MALIFEVKVIPSSGTFGFFKDKNGTLKCHLKSAPERGQANKELIKELARLLGVVQSDIEIIAGLTVRTKKIKLHVTYTQEQVYEALQLSSQQKLPF